MRLFAAIELEQRLKDRLGALKNDLGHLSGVKWVRPGNMHLTLRFFGECSPEVAGQLERDLANIERPAVFSLPLVRLGFLPNARSPRVFTVFGESRPELIELQSQIEEAAQRAGLPAEKRAYTPHLTIGRIRDPRQGRRLAKAVEGLENPPASIECRAFALIESRLTPSGPIYSKLADFEFPKA